MNDLDTIRQLVLSEASLNSTVEQLQGVVINLFSKYAKDNKIIITSKDVGTSGAIKSLKFTPSGNGAFVITAELLETGE